MSALVPLKTSFSLDLIEYLDAIAARYAFSRQDAVKFCVGQLRQIEQADASKPGPGRPRKPTTVVEEPEYPPWRLAHCFDEREAVRPELDPRIDAKVEKHLVMKEPGIARDHNGRVLRDSALEPYTWEGYYKALWAAVEDEQLDGAEANEWHRNSEIIRHSVYRSDRVRQIPPVLDDDPWRS